MPYDWPRSIDYSERSEFHIHHVCSCRKNKCKVQWSHIHHGVSGSHHSLLGKTMLHKLLNGKIWLCEHGCLWTPHPPHFLKLHTYLDTKHLHNAWVADATIFCGGWVNNYPCLSTCIYIFQCWANSFCHIVNYFQPRVVKTALGEIVLDRGGGVLYIAFNVLFSVYSL
jgi:hypothetical protein